jgi:hypothetical protein
VTNISNGCSAAKNGGLAKIREALDSTIKAHGFTANVEDWLSPYYQFANRLAHLDFLLKHNIRARLILLYFCGDDWGGKALIDGRPPKCPKEAQGWDGYLRDMHQRLGMHGSRRQLHQQRCART